MARRFRQQRVIKVIACLWVTSVLVFLFINFPEAFSSPNISRFAMTKRRIPSGHHDSERTNSGIDDTFPSRKKNTDRVAHRVIAKFLPKTQEEYYQPRPTKVNRLNSEFLISNRRFCEVSTPYVLAVVPSIATHTSIRSAIRATYGSYWAAKNSTRNDSQAPVRVLFFFGRGANADVDVLIQEESRKYKDIVQADFQESYSNLTLKMMVILKWVATFCGEVDYMLKIDEDVFVNIPVLISQLKPVPYTMDGSVLGHLNSDSTVRKTGKWGVRLDQFPFPTYPTYASGNSYVISGNIIPRMFMVSEYMPYIHIEDVFVSGILAKIVGAKHISLEGFTFWLEPQPSPCKFVHMNRTTATKVSATLMRRLWAAQTAYDQTCHNNY